MSGRIGPYEIERLGPSVWAIDTDADESIYLVCGDKKAAVIDTGSADAPLLEVIRSLWNGPVELVLTHAHFDHIYRSGEFASVSIGAAEKRAWKRILGPIVWFSSAAAGKKPRRYGVGAWRALEEGDRIDLGDRSLLVVNAKGHTPGSIVLVDEADRMIFTGDAFGSGSFAWMWMPGCSCLSEYRESLRALLEKLAPYRDFRMLGGHRRQGIPSASEPLAGPLCYETAEDMEKLCTAVLGGLTPERTERNFGVKNYLYRRGRAAVVLTGGKIK